MNWLHSARNRVSKLLPVAQGNLSCPAHRPPGKRRFAPRVEELETRLTPAALTVSTTNGGSGLVIAATTAAQLRVGHSVTIRDDGKGDITVNLGGAGNDESFTGITSITVSGGLRTDTVSYFLTDNLRQSQNLTVHMKPNIDVFDVFLFHDIGNSSGRTTTPGNLTIQVPGSALGQRSAPRNSGGSGSVPQVNPFFGVNLSVTGNVLAGSSLTFVDTVGGPSTVTVSGDILGTAHFTFINGGDAAPVDFEQRGNISGSEVVTMQGFTAASRSQAVGQGRVRLLVDRGITDLFSFSGKLTGSLDVSEVAGTIGALPIPNSLDEEFTLADGSTGKLSASENNQPNSRGLATLNVTKDGRVSTSVAGTIDAAFRSRGVTNDPGDVTITATP
jgi:hypothetical protein